ncbi:MAG: hypothetical protein IH867_09680 [Chloroflexi bacterium]|nr:hypothetical protein [Chloroflexota bacterium]
MGRRSKWVGKDDMWRYCAIKISGGVSYDSMNSLLDTAEMRKRFGLTEVPSSDAIRYNVQKLGLMDSITPGTDLPPDELIEHHRGLAFLALAIRYQVGLPSHPAKDVSGSSSWVWHGFHRGPVLNPQVNEKHAEEMEVKASWTQDVSGPGEIEHYEYLLEHLDSTAKGREILDTLRSVIIQASMHMKAYGRLKESILERLPKTSSQDELVIRNIQRAGDAVLRTLHPTVRSPRGVEYLSRTKTDHRSAAIRILADLLDEDLHNSLIASWDASVKLSERLKRNLTPTSLVRRIIQEGTCQICASDSDFKRLEREVKSANKRASDKWPRSRLDGLPDELGS